MLKGGSCQTQIKAISHLQSCTVLKIQIQLNFGFTNTEEPLVNTMPFMCSIWKRFPSS